MTEDQAWSRMISAAAVTRQRVTLAKAFIVKNFHTDTGRLLGAFHAHVDAPFPDAVSFGGPEADENLKSASDALAWRLAFCEAIWELIHANAILPASTSMMGELRTLSWRRYAGGSYAIGQWSCHDLFLPVPQLLRRPPSAESAPTEALVDGDLFLKELDIPDIDPEIEGALREAVKCFRHELFLACLAMLGKASEGTWIKLGRALAAGYRMTKAKKLYSSSRTRSLGLARRFLRCSSCMSVQTYELRSSNPPV